MGRRRQGGRGDRVGVTAARVDSGEAARGRGAGVVQAGFTEGTDGPRVMVVRQSCLPTVQPGDPRAVDEVRPAHLGPSQTSVGLAVGHSGPGWVMVVRVSL